MSTLRRPTALGLTLLALVVAGAGAWLRLGALIDAQRPVDHAHRVLAEIGRLGVVATATDRAQRAFLAGDDPRAYRTYRDASAALDRSITAVRALTAGDPVQGRIVAAIDTVATEARDGHGKAAELDHRFGRLAELVAAAHDHESAVLDRRLRTGSASVRDARALIVGMVACAALLVAFAWWGTRRAETPPERDAEAAAARRTDVERHLAAPAEVEEVRGALAGTG